QIVSARTASQQLEMWLVKPLFDNARLRSFRLLWSLICVWEGLGSSTNSCRTSTKRGRGRITGRELVGKRRKAFRIDLSFRTPNLKDAHRFSLSQIERASRATSQLIGGS